MVIESFIETPPKQYKKTTKKAPAKTAGPEKDETKMDTKAQYKRVKQLHKREIKQAKADIKKHKLLIKQARITYKLSK